MEPQSINTLTAIILHQYWCSLYIGLVSNGPYIVLDGNLTHVFNVIITMQSQWEIHDYPWFRSIISIDAANLDFNSRNVSQHTWSLIKKCQKRASKILPGNREIHTRRHISEEFQVTREMRSHNNFSLLLKQF